MSVSARWFPVGHSTLCATRFSYLVVIQLGPLRVEDLFYSDTSGDPDVRQHGFKP